MQYKIRLGKIFAWIIVCLLLNTCVSLALVSPSFNYNNNYSGNNPNQINCDVGSFFSYPECSIPISRFVALTASYSDALESDAMINYAINNKAFIFNDLDKTATLESLNSQIFSNHKIARLRFDHFPDSLQQLYYKQYYKYIPKKDYKKQMETYIYLFTLNAMHFATTPCASPPESGLTSSQLEYQQQFIIYKAFSIQYTNNILRHIGSGYFHFDTKYENEDDLYEHLYAKILMLNASQLLELAQAIYKETAKSAPLYNREFYQSGLTFGVIGKFSCTQAKTSWEKYGSDFFGINVSGGRMLVHFKNRDVFSDTTKTKFKIINN